MVRSAVFCVFEGYFGKKQPQKCCFRGQIVVKSVANVDSKLHLFGGGKICNIFRYFFSGTEVPPGDLLVSPPCSLRLVWRNPVCAPYPGCVDLGGPLRRSKQ